MALPNSSSLASAYETTTQKKGSRIRTSTQKSDATLLREQGMQEIYDNAVKAGLTVDQYITRMLCNSGSELKAYVLSKGETPLDDCVSLGIQAALLRAADVGRTASILGVDDETALQNIEQSEQDAITQNLPEKYDVLTTPAQAAIACALYFLQQQSGQTMYSFIKSFQGAAKTAAKVNNIDNIGDVSDESDWTDWLGDGSSGTQDPNQQAATDNSYNYSSIGTGLAAIGGTGANVSVASTIPTITAGPSGGTTAGTTSAGGVLNGILSVINGVTNVANAVTGAANSSAGAAGAVKNAISNVGANSIATYINNNKSTIILVVILIVAAIVLVIYARKH